MRRALFVLFIASNLGCDEDDLPPPAPIGAGTESPGGAVPAVGMNPRPDVTGTSTSTTGSATAGSATAGSATAGSATAGSATAGSATAGSATAGTATAGTGATLTATASDTDFGETIGDTAMSSTEGIECQSACDCPPLTLCTADGCMPSSQLVWCCGEPTCPTGEDCQTPDGAAGVCP